MRAKYGLNLGTGYEIARNAANIPLQTGLGYYYGTELGAGLGLDETAQRRIGTYGAISSGLSSAGTFMDSLWKRREAKERNAYLQSLDYVNQPYDRYAYNSNLGGPLQGNYFERGGLTRYQEGDTVPPDQDLTQNYFTAQEYRKQLSDRLKALEEEQAYVKQVREQIPRQAARRVGNTKTRTRLPAGSFYCNTRSCEVLQDAGARVAKRTKSVRNSGYYEQGQPMPIIPGNQSFLARARDLGFQEVRTPEAGDLVQYLHYPSMVPRHSVIYAGRGSKPGTHDVYSDPGQGDTYFFRDDANIPQDLKIWRYVGRTPELESQYAQLQNEAAPYINRPMPDAITLPTIAPGMLPTSFNRIATPEPGPDVSSINPREVIQDVMYDLANHPKNLRYQPYRRAYFLNKQRDFVIPSPEAVFKPAPRQAAQIGPRGIPVPQGKKGGLIKRADGSYSQRGLWDNIRANKGSGRKPTEEMLEQERKIKAKMEEGGSVRNGTTKRSTRKGKKMAVYMDGTWHHFGDSSMDDYRTHKSEKRKEAFYSRHRKNLQGDSPRAKAFRVYARKTWQTGGMVTPVGFDPSLKPCYKCGGKVKMQEGGEVDFYDSDPEQLYIDHVGNQDMVFTREVGPEEAYKPLETYAPMINPQAPKGGSIAVSHNNPGNIKFGKFAQSLGAQPGRPATDGGLFAVFPNLETGLAAQRRLLTSANYRNLTVNSAMKRWSNNGYGGEIYPAIANKKVSDLTESELKELQRRQIKREDGNMYRAIYGQ